MQMRYFISVITLFFGLACFGASDSIHSKIDAVFGIATNKRGRAVTVVQPLEPAKCALVFIYSEHPDLIKDTVLEEIASGFIRTHIPSSYDETRLERDDLSARLKHTLLHATSKNLELETLTDVSSIPKKRTACRLVSIILAPKRMHFFDFFTLFEGIKSYKASNGLSDTLKDEYHEITLGNYIWGSHRGSKHISAQERAQELQRLHPKEAFHFVIDNVLWRDLCSPQQASEPSLISLTQPLN